jgi:GINS complex subunit 2
MAINLKQRQKCRLTSPEWMTVETLTKIKEDEGQSKTFTPMPDEHYMVTTQLILGAAPHDIPNTDEIRILVKVVFLYIECIQQINNYDCLQDIWDMRIAKLRSSVDAFLKIGGSLAKVDHLTLMEINTVRPFLPHALDQLFRLRQVV